MRTASKTLKQESATSKISVWIIEDNHSFRESLKKLINSNEGIFCSDTFSTCEEALEKLNTAYFPQVILLDLGLPGMSGIEGIGRIKSIAPAIQIIVITVYDDNDKILNAICAGASGYLLKASSEEKIIEAINDVHSGGAPMNPHIARKVVTMFAEIRPPANNFSLTIREKEILDWMVKGFTKKQIAENIHLSYHTVDTHIRSIYYKLQVHTRTGAVAKALKGGY
jgi:DNA-binding NarL/FixJ family response regulator